MDLANSPRGGDRDGRGNLSEAALKTFSEWFLKVTLDQITFSKRLFELGGLDHRYRRLVADTIDDKRAADLILAVLRHGALDRGDAQIVLKTPVRLAFPLDYRERLFPNLFGDGDLPAQVAMEASGLWTCPRAYPLTMLDRSSQL